MKPVVLILAALLTLSACKPGPIRGTAEVIDGDTVRVGGVKVRLWGIDAPELAQAGGPEAATTLRRVVAGRVLTCERKGVSRDRVVALCRLPGGGDVGERLVELGAALDCPAFSKGAYRVKETAEARAALTRAETCGEGD